MRKQLKVQPSYGYKHPDCGIQPPPGVQPDQPLQFVMQLCSWYPAKQVSALPAAACCFAAAATMSMLPAHAGAWLRTLGMG